MHRKEMFILEKIELVTFARIVTLLSTLTPIDYYLFCWELNQMPKLHLTILYFTIILFQVLLSTH